MYLLATTATYQGDTKYYSKSGDIYTLLVEGTDYTVGGTITGTIYELARPDRLYIRDWGDTNPYKRFPYTIGGVNTLPEHDVGENDVDLDAYTNTRGRTVRNRVRSNVATIEFNIPTMMGDELHKLNQRTKDVWLDCLFFYEDEWGFVSKKMYRNATMKFHRYYIDVDNMDNSIYQNVNFGFVEE